MTSPAPHAAAAAAAASPTAAPTAAALARTTSAGETAPLPDHLLRGLSEHSRWVAQRALAAPDRREKDASVATALELTSLAFRLGVITFRDKCELKDAVLMESSSAAIERLRRFPGSSRAFQELRARRKREASGESAPALGSPSRCHTLASGYVVHMATREHALLEHAMRFADVTDDSPKLLVGATSTVAVVSLSRAQSSLHPDTRRVMRTPNAGGPSVQSEAVSYETVHALFRASGVLTETEVAYWTRNTSIADYVCTAAGRRVAVSVTRALRRTWPGPRDFNAADAESLLRRKLLGLDRARLHVAEGHAWAAQLLHVWVQTEEVRDLLLGVLREQRFPTSTAVLLTLCADLDHVVFGNEPEFELPDPDALHKHLASARRREAAAVAAVLQASVGRLAAVRRAEDRLLGARESARARGGASDARSAAGVGAPPSPRASLGPS